MQQKENVPYDRHGLLGIGPVNIAGSKGYLLLAAPCKCIGLVYTKLDEIGHYGVDYVSRM